MPSETTTKPSNLTAGSVPALLTSNGKLAQMLLDAAPDAMVIVDQQGKMILVNRQTEQMFGYSRNELLNQPVEVLLPERFRKRHVEHRANFVAEPRIRAMGSGLDLYARCRDGSEFSVDIMLSPLVLEGRTLVTAAIRDSNFNRRLRDTNENLLISSVKQHELAELAQQAEQRLSLAIGQSSAVFFTMDSNLRYTWIRNAPGSWSPERSIGQTDADVFPPEAAANLIAPKRRALETGERVREIVQVPREGQMNYWDLTIEPSFGVDGAVVGIACMAFDVTAHVVAEQELEVLTQSLRDTLRVNTESLDVKDRQLLVAEQMAALGTVAAGLTHDLGNILFPIRASLDNLETMAGMHVRSEVLREDLASIRQCTGYLQRLCENVRLLMAPSHSTVHEGKSTDLHVWWQEISGLIRIVLPANVELVANLLAELPHVKLDRSLLTQMVFNLAHNAGRAMRRQRSACLRISARGVKENSCVRLEVSDNGPGMTPEEKRHCMEISFSTRDDQSASGIGLALVNSIVSRSMGTIEIESELGVGTTISIVLPAVV